MREATTRAAHLDNREALAQRLPALLHDLLVDARLVIVCLAVRWFGWVAKEDRFSESPLNRPVVRVGCQIRQVLRITALQSGGSGGFPNKAGSPNHRYVCSAWDV